MSTATYDDVLAKLIAYLGETLEDKPDKAIEANTHLIQDLNLDSIQRFEMAADLEDHYEIELELEAFQEVESVGDLARAVSRLLGAGA